MKTPDPMDTLRSLDPAANPTPAGGDRAARLLERVIASPVDADSHQARPVAADSGRLRRRVAVIGTVAATAVAASVLLPEMTGSGMAYASWTATPSAVANGDLNAAAERCRSELATLAKRSGTNADGARMVLAERRGNIVGVLFHQDRPQLDFFCLATVKPGSGKVTSTEHGMAETDDSMVAAPAGSVTEGSMIGFGDQAWMVAGAAGAGVKQVIVNAPGKAVTATVTNGRYFAWAPGAFGDDALSYNLTLTDGTTRARVMPAPSSGDFTSGSDSITGAPS